jgi:hypothetical protein
MDELVAAAAVVPIVVDANAAGDVGQRGSGVTVSADDAVMPDVETTAEDKEHDSAHAAVGNPEDAASKVSSALSMPRNLPSVQHLTRSDSTPHTPHTQVSVEMLLSKSDAMFPEGTGAVRAFVRDGAAAQKSNELLENASTAVEKHITHLPWSTMSARAHG